MAEQGTPPPTATDMSEPFWAAAREGRFRLQTEAEGRPVFPPRPPLQGDGSGIDAAGTGTLLAVTVARVPAPGFAPPFTVGIVRLDEGPRVFATLVDTGDAIVPGRRMRMVWRDDADGAPRYAFAPAD